MGFGDALIAAGQAQDYYAQDPSRGPIALLASSGKPRWNPVWWLNPVVWVPGTSPMPSRTLITGGGCLPYLQYPVTPTTGWRFTDWRVCQHRPAYVLHDTERLTGQVLRDRIGPFIILEPTADRKHPNRRPPRAFWDDVFVELQHRLALPIVQLLHAHAEYLRGTIPHAHEEFRQACAILSAADLLITTEGGLAHAAAALGVPAVVLWGGNVSVDNLGYPEHVNLVDNGPQTPCGALVACDHCAAAWARLPPHAVAIAAGLALEAARGLSRSRQPVVR